MAEQTDTQPDPRTVRREAATAAQLSRLARRNGTLRPADAARRARGVWHLWSEAGLSPSQIAAKIGVTDSRVCQLLAPFRRAAARAAAE